MKTLKLIFTSVLVITLTTAYQVQENEITFYLYNQHTFDLKLTKDNLCAVEADKDVHFVVHGRRVSRNVTWVARVTEALLSADDHNVIQVDWSGLAAQPDPYPIDSITNAEGQSLGAHVASFAGKHTRNALGQKVRKITGLDRANEEFSDDPAENGLHRNDAEVVAVVHTDDLGLGKVGSVGTVNFYANGGLHPQPGCMESQTSCSHAIVTDFFLESIENPKAFLSTKCDTYEDYLSGACQSNDKVALAGNLEGRDGDYFFETNPEKPYSKEDGSLI